MIALRVAIANEAGSPASSITPSGTRAVRLRRRGNDPVPRAIDLIVVHSADRSRKSAAGRWGRDAASLGPGRRSLGRSPLRPFTDVDTLAVGTEAIFTNVDAELGRQFAYLRTNGLLDLANRKGKAPGGYQTTLEDDRLPFIFMNALVSTATCGRCFTKGARLPRPGQRGEPLAAYRESPIEFCEWPR